jgi:hypothetical protein
MKYKEKTGLWREASVYEGKRYDLTDKTEVGLIIKIHDRKRDIDEDRQRVTKRMLVKDWLKEYPETYRVFRRSGYTNPMRWV